MMRGGLATAPSGIMRRLVGAAAICKTLREASGMAGAPRASPLIDCWAQMQNLIQERGGCAHIVWYIIVLFGTGAHPVSAPQT